MLNLLCRPLAGAARQSPIVFRRYLTTLKSNPHLYLVDNPSHPTNKYVTFLPTEPPTPQLAAGQTSENPPSPRTFQENHDFLKIVNSVIAENAHNDPQVKAQAAAMASSAGGSFSQPDRRATTGSAGASDQGGAGGATVGGWIHVSDNRRPPDFGRIAEPEDIFGSVEVDQNGEFTDTYGHYQESGTYRICTIDGILELPDYLRQKLVERLKLEEAAIKNKK